MAKDINTGELRDIRGTLSPSGSYGVDGVLEAARDVLARAMVRNHDLSASRAELQLAMSAAAHLQNYLICGDASLVVLVETQLILLSRDASEEYEVVLERLRSSLVPIG